MDLRSNLVVVPAAARRLGARLPAYTLAAALLGLPALAAAQSLLDAYYSPAQDALVVEIAYQGTNPNHEFAIVWDACQPTGGGRQAVVGRLIDSQGNDAAQKEFQVRRRLPLADLPCRPADVTVRIGPVSNRSVPVPSARR